MAKRTRQTVTTTTEQEEIKENLTSGLVRKFFDSGEFNPELSDFCFEIRVQKYSSQSGKYITLVGTKYSNLETLVETIGTRYGSGKYKFYIKVKDSENKIIGGAIIEDYEFLWDSDEVPEGSELIGNEVETITTQESPMIELMKLQLKQQNDLLLAILNRQSATSGIPMKGNEVLNAIQTGIELAGGKNEAAQSGEFDLNRLIDSPLGKLLIEKILEKTTPPTS